ncbi:hypothetical protein ARAM_002032 [Aspergillus rambellii]|uniref:Uracil-DNA glycosylase-like domain-containing protein n=2 Tax=Aspergillus subgen. Nidulantes TaxID=2720870 RepID=A0A0F8XQG0_9EURO|nr:hypothetical protein AOCH_003648 [Aspergillus ochraceoroseus]KKK25762.1 hypothetical protein ARAM_002032 [Aspergillus rambellii]
MTLPKQNDETSSDPGPVPSDDDVPVNKITSFNGGLKRYIHVSQTVTSSTTSGPTQQDAKRDSDTTLPLDNEPASSKRRKKLESPTVTTITSSSTATVIPARSRRSRQQTSAPSSPTKTPRTPTPSASVSRLQDTLPPNLDLLLVGVNPGIMTGATGFAYAHPSNLFWKLLHSSGITPIRHPPSDTYRLPGLYNIGNTNIVERPTRDASMLGKAEMDAGVPVLEEKVAAKRPQAVCLVGKGIWEAVWRARKGRAIRKEEFRYGWQDAAENMGRSKEWAGARVFVATTTSGLAASMTLAEKEAVWNQLGEWVVQKREEKSVECK